MCTTCTTHRTPCKFVTCVGSKVNDPNKHSRYILGQPPLSNTKRDAILGSLQQLLRLELGPSSNSTSECETTSNSLFIQQSTNTTIASSTRTTVDMKILNSPGQRAPQLVSGIDGEPPEPYEDEAFSKFDISKQPATPDYKWTQLHWACANDYPMTAIQHLGTGATEYLNAKDGTEQTPIHMLISSTRITLESVEAIRFLVKSGTDLSLKNSHGDTPFLCVKYMLDLGEFEKAIEVAKILLEARCDINASNSEGRTLLTYSVSHLDTSASFTRFLLNSGAPVWAEKDFAKNNPYDYSAETASAFTWFLRAIIHHRRVEHCDITMHLLAAVMAEDPIRMRSHVIRTMFRHVRCYQVLGPVFYQIKCSMMKYWTKPQDLKYLCWKSVRKHVGSRRLISSLSASGLPPATQKYLLME